LFKSPVFLMGFVLAKWFLDAYVSSGWVFLVFYDEDSHSLETRRFDLDLYGYIAGGEPGLIAAELRGIDGVLDAWVEDWRTPPFYDSLKPVVVFKTRSYSVLRSILGLASVKGLRVVNTYPHPLVEALYRAGIQPVTPVKSLSNGGVETTKWDPGMADPVLNYALVGFEDGYYVLESPESREKFWSIEELAEHLSSRRLHLGFADPYVYSRLIEVEPGIASVAYRWVTGGFYSPHEYFEWSRLSYTPLSLMSNITIGRVLTTIEALYARDRKIIVDKSRGRREGWRSISELLLFDRGGVVYQPRPGLYWWVCQVDFKSLYPSIMVKYNVSGETIDKPNCGTPVKPEWTPHTICLDEEGVVSASIGRLIDLKDVYDKLYKETGDTVYEERKKAVKWILVASFGYLGYRNSLFGSVMAHEVVTSTSREVLRRARLVVEEMGYRVVHGIVDSLFVAGVGEPSECDCVKDRIVEETGFDAKVEAHYVWLYIPRCLNSSDSVANKYYGLLTSGFWKVKGVMAVRSDTPPLVKKAELEALAKLFEARTPSELEEKIEEANHVIDEYVELVEKREVDPRELVVSRTSGVRDRYRRPPRYVLESKPPYRLIYVNGELVPFEKALNRSYDVDKYVELLEKTRRELPSRIDLLNSYVEKTLSRLDSSRAPKTW